MRKAPSPAPPTAARARPSWPTAERLFLDEICEMDLALQAKLLRFIQTGQFMRVGGSQLKTVDVRFVCATNKEPMAAVQSGAFRADLFYRLHVLPVVLPPLRERDGDVLDIARHALAQYSAEEGKTFRQLSDGVERLLLNYWWPGNVRELLNVIRNVVVMNDGVTVTANMIPLALAQGAASELSASANAAFAALDHAAPDNGCGPDGRDPQTAMATRTGHHRAGNRGLRRKYRQSRGPSRHQPIDHLPQTPELGSAGCGVDARAIPGPFHRARSLQIEQKAEGQALG